jgi:hypothetical protein
MKYLKTFENYSINEEEEFIKAMAQKVSSFFGKYNEETRKKAESLMAEFGKKFPDSNANIVFNKLKEAYDAKSELKLDAANTGSFKYEATTISAEEVKTLFENACCIISMNEANAWGLAKGKDGKLEVIQTKSYSASTHSFGSGGSGKS